MGRVVPLGVLDRDGLRAISLPTFLIVEVALPQASGFAMLALILAPMMFLYAYLMAFRQTLLLGYMGVLYFFTATGVQNRMAYNPIGFVNLTIAALLACAWASPCGRWRRRIRLTSNGSALSARQRKRCGRCWTPATAPLASAASKAPSAARWFDCRASSISPVRRTRPASRPPSRCSAPAASSPAVRPPGGRSRRAAGRRSASFPPSATA